MSANGGGEGYRRLSYWMDSSGDDLSPREPLSGDHEADVAIVGAGFTGLWTAYYLKLLEPAMRVAVLEREVAGYGASGRNGGWCSALFAASDARIDREFGRDAMFAMRRAMEGTVDEVGAAADREGIDCHFRKEGTVDAARSPAQLVRLRAEVEEARSLGLGEEHLRFMERDEAAEAFGATSVLGATFTPHCAAIHPARLVRGLAGVVSSRGVELFEKTPLAGLIAGRGRKPVLVTDKGRLTAGAVVLATEGYTAGIAGYERQVAPIYSMMVATEPLGEEARSRLGSAIAKGATFTDGRHLLIYGQLTVDGRLCFGGRGAPYHFGSRVDGSFDTDEKVHTLLPESIAELFPFLAPVSVTHRWGGPIGVHRDWFPSVSFDEETKVAAAGGYVGDGVATTNLAGRTLADLLTGRSSELTALCWVAHRSPSWEPEPLRWIGVNAGLQAMRVADAIEARTRRPSKVAELVGRLSGH